MMNKHFYQQPVLFDHRNKISSPSNFSFNPDLLRELNARYLHDMNMNRFSTLLQSKHSPEDISTSLNKPFKADQNLSSSPIKKSNKWCTAHVRISWMIYQHQQQQRLKDKLSLIDKKKHDEQQISSNGSLFSPTRKADIATPIPPPSIPFPPVIGSFSSVRNDHYLSNKKSSLSLSRKASSDNCKPFHSLPSSFPPIDPFALSMIERQRLSAAYASLFASTSAGKNFLPMNFDPTIFHNHNSSTVTAALIQREHFLNSLRLSQQQQQQQQQQQNKTLKTKFEQLSSINHEETKRIKRDHPISPST